jgi:exopolysaccharide biosynthesis protein PssK
VITDRLHAHILCLLMDIPHVVVDNSYGKVRSFVETWTAGAPGVRLCRDWSEAGAALAAGNATEAA